MRQLHDGYSIVGARFASAPHVAVARAIPCRARERAAPLSHRIDPPPEALDPVPGVPDLPAWVATAAAMAGTAASSTWAGAHLPAKEAQPPLF
jgi:hypothetical protein